MINLLNYKSLYKFVFLTLLFLVGVTIASAQTLEVQFEQNPLFQDTDVKPGDSTTRTVTITNNGNDQESVYVDVRNTFSDGLAGVMKLKISSGGNVYYDDNFNQFFVNTPVGLGSLNSGNNRIYDFTAYIDASVGNDYQKTTMGFDLCVGFSGGEVACDGSTNGSGGTTPGGGGGGGGSNNSNSNSNFYIFNETVGSIDSSTGSAILTWNTNRNSTTYLVCGNVVNKPFTLDPNASYFGYEFDITEKQDNTETHSVTLTGLNPGTYECRPAGRPDTNFKFTVGDSLLFTIPHPGEVLGASTDNFGMGGDGVLTSASTGGSVLKSTPDQKVLGASTSNPDDPAGGVAGARISGDEQATGNNLNLQSLIANCVLWWLFLLVVISFTWSVIEDVMKSSRRNFRPLFIKQLIFTIVYLIALLAAYWFGFVDRIWWLFAGAWTIMTIVDYRSHRDIFEFWNSKYRNLFYTLAGLLFILTSFWLAFPCIWWPFLIIALVSAIVFIFDGRQHSQFDQQ